MSKDPAVLFYTSDFLTGTATMTNEEVGMYIRLLCLQHQKHKLTEKDMLFICQRQNEDIFAKFKKDEDGYYFNVRMREECEKRVKYSESRSNNRKKKQNQIKSGEDMNNICFSHEQHMENENENENKDVIVEGGMGGCHPLNPVCVNDVSILDEIRHAEMWLTQLSITYKYDLTRVRDLADLFCKDRESLNDYVNRPLHELRKHFVNSLHQRYNKSHEKPKKNSHSIYFE